MEEGREDLKSIMGYLPLVWRSSCIFWPSQTVEALKVIAGGPEQSHIDSGELLFVAISDLRHSLSLSAEPLAPSAPDGYGLFFNQLISSEESSKWFEEVVPALANLLLKLPSLLELHYQNQHGFGLRLLDSQQPGTVLLGQELIGALLGCSFFCLFPVSNRGPRDLPTINFDRLFACLYDHYSLKQQSKIRCIIHYFERICSHMPAGYVSFERKILPLERPFLSISYPNAAFWSTSRTPLCRLEVCSSGLIEDQSSAALEVDFANKYIGGGALHSGCVQEEIRFMINPELIAGMLFLPSMADNEAIEILGSERFSNYTGYASSFRFSGDHVDKREVDSFGRRKTRIIAIDALCSPGMRQYKLECLLREVNKAFCGFLDQSKYRQYERLSQDNGYCGAQHYLDIKEPYYMTRDALLVNEATSTSVEIYGGNLENVALRNSQEKSCQSLVHEDNLGVVTGNWGCGAFGGDPELKAIIQWLAASQGLRPFISYYTVGLQALHNLKQVSEWILSHEWTVGDLWNMVAEYSLQRLNGKIIDVGFFTWLLPSLSANHTSISDLLDTT
ncbi:poly(ADP-ribose) glycohydrolase 1 isoform X1 [Ziziphus jujuba]|uniref:poly(ADP-ribose) glycohydrolase n=1 Tax=Ziziphus jujuba TaxID=326968 RepID=A0A6P3ZVI6_ZIZJJ|nr:poly(ADP-ribose) glycohydrolase 1 isoform X1 [Ziziphus jujuba]